MEVCDIWNQYERIKEYHIINDMYEKVKMCFRFYEGDQWYGVEKSGERLPKYNIIKPCVDYKTAMVAKNNMGIIYSPSSNEDKAKNDIYSAVCNKMNDFSAIVWEKTKMDSKIWEIVKKSCITGDSYLYFYDKFLNSQVIAKENIYFSDETQTNIQKQSYIIIYERRNVYDIKCEAVRNSVAKEDIEKIVGDNDNNENTVDNIKDDNSKCASLLYLYKDNGEVCYLRCTQNVIYSPAKKIKGLNLYPLASYIWTNKYNSARGVGEVYEMIPNQISANSLLVRREMNNKMTGYAKPVYNADLIENPESISKVGTAIKVSGPTVTNVSDVFSYISPAPMSATVKQLQDEILDITRELSGAGMNISGNVDPQKTSGAAIIAAQEQATIPLNENTEYFKQFVEDVARIWFNMWVCYNPNGMTISYEKNGEKVDYNIPPHILSSMRVNVKIDIAPINPFSKYARERAVENALERGYITFGEYVNLLDDNSAAPKNKFEDILKNRDLSQEQSSKDEDEKAKELGEVKL